jgi:hypothetical protein
MTLFRSRAAGALAAAAALSLSATPAMARGWHRHHNRVDSGDVFAGLLVFGGIAAIAAAASKSNKDRQAREDERTRDYRDNGRYQEVPPQSYDDGRYDGRGDDQRRGPGSYGPSRLSVDGAVDACVGAVEQGRRSIDSVDSVNREGDGWRVQGRDRDGHDFACSVDRDGRIAGVSGA